jgi:DNA-binding CsgD family transcriptional regulator
MKNTLQEIFMEQGFNQREAEVIEWVTKGLDNKEIGEKLFIVPNGVKWHLTKIYKRLSIRDRTQLVIWCIPFIAQELVQHELAARSMESLMRMMKETQDQKAA